MKTKILATALGLVLPLAACGGDDGGGDDDGVGSVGGSEGGDAGATGGEKGSSGGADEAGSGDAGGDDGAATSGGDTGGGDEGGTFGGMCTASDECMTDAECGGGSCVDCICVGGDDGGGASCPSNVSTQNPACDSCLAESCCSQFQTCFGDETVTMETPCLQLNNCIAMNCAMAADVASLQECVNTNCADTAGEFNNWISFTQCLGTNCMSQCAG